MRASMLEGRRWRERLGVLAGEKKRDGDVKVKKKKKGN